MSGNEFVDYYELLQLSPNAAPETIDRVFRHLAKKFHPDNAASPDPERFGLLVEAHRVLSNPESRAGYDARHMEFWDRRWGVASEATGSAAFQDDRGVRERLLSLLYVQRRRDMHNPGLGEMEISRLLASPAELMEFHFWYLKSKGWLERLESGQFAITAAGVDEVERTRLTLGPERLLARTTEAAGSSEGGETALLTAE
jgi:curved DNA-binding protein CbpA